MPTLYEELIYHKFEIIKQIIYDIRYLKIKVEGDSMKPTILSNDKVLINYSSVENLKVDDIVLYVEMKEMKLHRIIEIISDEYLVKGDNEDYRQVIRYSQILGKLTNDIVILSCSKKYTKMIENYKFEISIYNNEIIGIEVLLHG